MITKYPPVGSKWTITPGPDIPRTLVYVISSGHGVVVVKQIGGNYAICIDILRWDGVYQPEEVT